MHSINDNLESIFTRSLNSKRSTLNFCLKIVSSTLHMLHCLHKGINLSWSHSFYCSNGVEIRTIGKSVSFFFSEDVNEIISNRLQNPATLVTSLAGLISPIRQAMSKISSMFNNSFPPDCQKASVPIQLQILCSSLIDDAICK